MPHFGCSRGAVDPPMIPAAWPFSTPEPHAFHFGPPPPPPPFCGDAFGFVAVEEHSFRPPRSGRHRHGHHGRRHGSPHGRRGNRFGMPPFGGEGFPFFPGPQFGGEGMPFFHGQPFHRPSFHAEAPPFVGEWPHPMWGIGRRSFGWKETAEAYLVKVCLPGLKKEDVKVDVELEGTKMLRISHKRGEFDDEEEEDQVAAEQGGDGGNEEFETWRCRLPENSKVEEISAAMENGVLTVTVPKVEATRAAEVRVVEISG